jgi:hypothetical protein
LLARGRSEDHHQAATLLEHAHGEAAAMGMRRLAADIRACVNQLDLFDSGGALPAHERQMLAGGAAATGQTAPPQTGGEPALSRASAACCDGQKQLPARPGSAQSGEACFRYDSDHWTVGYGGTVIRLRRLKGLNLIAYLLKRPHQEVRASVLDDLIGWGSGARPSGTPAPANGDLGPLLDPCAKRNYRRRLQELREELEQARCSDDLQRASIAEEEIHSIARELSRAVGLGGRDRKLASETERARLRVTSAIKWAINRISSQHRSLGRFLELSIKTGTSCSYAPDSRCPPPDWKF